VESIVNGLSLYYPGGEERVELNKSVSVGRDGDVVLTLPRNREDIGLSSRALYITADLLCFAVEVPPGKSPVTVHMLVEGRRSDDPRWRREVKGGARQIFAWDAAEISMLTERYHHRVRIAMDPSHALDHQGSTGTETPFPLDLAGNWHHRLLVAFCGPRLNDPEAPVPTYSEALDVLAASGRAEDRSLNPSSATTAWNRTLLPELRWMARESYDLDALGEAGVRRLAVDYCVRVGIVKDWHYKVLTTGKQGEETIAS
jgi:hypothetical protein